MVPSNSCLQNAAKIAIKNEKPILLDYYLDSMKKECKIVKNQEGEKFLFKNKDEYTSPLVSMFKIETDVVLETQNSIYLVSVKMF
jgi:hypothetical protein